MIGLKASSTNRLGEIQEYLIAFFTDEEKMNKFIQRAKRRFPNYEFSPYEDIPVDPEELENG